MHGLITIYDGQNLKVKNTNLNLETIYENYPYLAENALFLTSFIQDYKNSKDAKYTEKNGEIIMEAKVENTSNKYSAYKKLYISKETSKPLKLSIQDINQNTLVYILYNEIEIDSVTKEDILAFNIKGLTKEI